ncbi:MAG: hypothetical protein U0903_21935 [Planctomycetales bacterium]
MTMFIGPKTLRSILNSRRWQSSALLLCFVLANICPILPVVAEKDHSQRYPCEQHACGCRSAEQCWRKCCCMSREQKLAWAKANHVTPPAEFLLAKEDAGTVPESTPPKKTCCAHKSATKQCCSRQPPARSAPQRKNNSEKESSDMVLVSQYLGCQGISLVWMNLQVTLPERISTLVTLDAAPAATLDLVNERLTWLAAPPDAPPPRSV